MQKRSLFLLSVRLKKFVKKLNRESSSSQSPNESFFQGIILFYPENKSKQTKG